MSALCFNQLCPSRSICKRARPRPIGRKYTVGSYTVKEGDLDCGDILERPKDGPQQGIKENTNRDEQAT